MLTAPAAAFLFVLVAFAAAMVVQAQRISRERDRATGEATTANAISAFCRTTCCPTAGAYGQAGAGTS